jgi:hypothetical protein
LIGFTLSELKKYITLQVKKKRMAEKSFPIQTARVTNIHSFFKEKTLQKAPASCGSLIGAAF